ncbi:helix-turn-helix domain-containing protein [Bacillus changyiensis]|uniref:helix-turn-helix domain-containing protein n=1 Tax=Bacillus changyiensis TaxID=3004103 RepID=UPI0022E71585|nr:LuxR C-terminal-related transcriptional regulator [Bacillus changyiensis]MDA1477526.1 LuxR C-terminal-related transcriptional regulator [Bacillus changyiensis]
MKEKEFQSKPLLTKREREVFELLVQDKTTKEIASELFISEKTVRNHISNAMHDCGKPDQSLYRLFFVR